MNCLVQAGLKACLWRIFLSSLTWEYPPWMWAVLFWGPRLTEKESGSWIQAFFPLGFKIGRCDLICVYVCVYMSEHMSTCMYRCLSRSEEKDRSPGAAAPTECWDLSSAPHEGHRDNCWGIFSRSTSTFDHGGNVISCLKLPPLWFFKLADCNQ